MNINVDLSSVIGTVATVVLGWLFTNISAWVRAKGDGVKQTNTHSQLDKYIDLVEQFVDEAVKAMNSTTVDALKAASSDGKLTPEEGQQILGDVLNSILKVLAPDVQTALTDVYGDLSTWLAVKIENAVKDNKTTTTTGTDGKSDTNVADNTDSQV